MIECDNCDAKFHLKCVKVYSLDENDQWNCSECVMRDVSRRPQSNDNSNPSTEPKGSKKDSENRSGDEKHSETRKSQKSEVKPQSVSSSVRRRTQLELERLEEERQLKEKRDGEYLDKKYQILQSDRHSSRSRSNASEIRNIDRTSLTREWVQNQSVENQPPSDSRDLFLEELIDDPEDLEEVQ